MSPRESTSLGRRAFAAATPTTHACAEVLGWEPATTLEDGLADTYAWIEEQVQHNDRGRPSLSREGVPMDTSLVT